MLRAAGIRPLRPPSRLCGRPSRPRREALRCGAASPRNLAVSNPACPSPVWPEDDAPPVTRYQKLTLVTIVATVLLVTLGVVVRATGSGMGCPDWPTCHGALDPADGRLQGVARVVASHRRGHHRPPDRRRRLPGLAGLRRPPLDPLAEPRRRRAGGLPGVARQGDRPPQQLRRVGDRAPRRRDVAAGPPRLPARAGGLPCADRRARGQPAVHAARRLQRGGHLRAAPVRFQRHGHLAVVRVPGLAPDGRLALPGAHRRELRARAAPVGRRRSSASSSWAPGGSHGARSAGTRSSCASAWRRRSCSRSRRLSAGSRS